jgi:hypothetical protein
VDADADSSQPAFLVGSGRLVKLLRPVVALAVI